MVRDLMELNLHKTRPVLAYLSACSTGVNEVEALNDEAIHIMSAFQLAGFQHVIGSLWSVSDSKSARMQEVYRTIVGGGMAPESISLGLHHAQRFIRSNPDEDMMMAVEEVTRGRKGKAPLGRPAIRPPRIVDPLIWAPFIHSRM